MAVTREQAEAELRRRRARRELDKRRSASGGAPIQADPAGTPQGTPTAQEVASASGATRRPTGDTQFPVTVGKAALPQSVNKIMRERGMDYNDRADALIGKAVADMGHGIKQLTTGLDPDDVADVEAWRALSAGASMDEGRGEYIDAGTVGELTGAVSAFAVPLGAAEQAAVKASTALPKWASKVGAAMGVGGAEGGLMPVLEDESRAANVALGAALPASLSVLGQAGRKAITQPFKLSRDAETLVEEGVMPTLGQGVETRGVKTPVATLAKNIEENLEDLLGFPGRGRAEQEVVDVLARRAVPPRGPMPDNVPGSPEYFHEVDNLFDTAYKDVIDAIPGRFDSARLGMAIGDAIDENGMMVNPSLKRQMERKFFGVLEKWSASGVPPKVMRQFQSKVRKERAKYASVENANENTTGAAEILGAIDAEISDMLEAKLGPEGAQRLKDIDLAYANKMLIETASGFTKGNEPIQVKHLERALRQRTGRARRVRGEGLGQDIVDPAVTTMGAPKGDRWRRALQGTLGSLATYGAGGPGLAVVPLAAAAIGSRRAGAELLFGLTPAQRQFKQFADEVVEPKIGTATALLSDNED